MSETAITVTGLGKRYLKGATEGMFRYRSLREDLTNPSLLRRRRQNARDEAFWALRNVSFTIDSGERVGIIGRNGAGKSTLLKILARVTSPSEGEATLVGRVGALLEVGTGFHPELSGRENIRLAGAILGMSRAEIRDKLDDIVAFAGVSEFLDTPVKRYSTGMYMRLAFSVAAHLEPDILLVDEVLAVGDADFQKKCLGRMDELGRSGRTVIFVSHNMPAILRLCDRVIVLDGGGVVIDGLPQQALQAYAGSTAGAASHREWSADAAGDSVARLRAVRVLDRDGQARDQVEIDEPVAIEITYEKLSPDPAMRPLATIRAFNEDSVLLFHSTDAANLAWRRTDRPAGVVVSTCHIPGNLLAEGRVFVHVGLGSINPLVIHADEPDAISFQIVDHTSGEGVRGEWVGDWPGVMRPMLEWRIKPEPAPPS